MELEWESAVRTVNRMTSGCGTFEINRGGQRTLVRRRHGHSSQCGELETDVSYVIVILLLGLGLDVHHPLGSEVPNLFAVSHALLSCLVNLSPN
jgi:hypothetical protein